MIHFDLRNWHRSVHVPTIEAHVEQSSGDRIRFFLVARSMDGVTDWTPIWERTFTVEELRQMWERAHVKGHMKNDQATAVKEDAINIAQWGRDYGIPK